MPPPPSTDPTDQADLTGPTDPTGRVPVAAGMDLAPAPPPSTLVIAGALRALPGAPRDPLAPATGRPPGADAAGGAERGGPAAEPGPPIVLPETLTRWLAGWRPASTETFEADGPILDELAHDRWLKRLFGSDGSVASRSPGWLAATRGLAPYPDVPGAALAWLAEPTYLHVATDHLILLHGAAATLDAAAAADLAASAAPMFAEAGLGFRLLAPDRWLVWPQAAPETAASTSASADDASPASAADTSPASAAGTTSASSAGETSASSASATPASRRPGPASIRGAVRVVGQRADTAPPLAATAGAAASAAAQGHSVDEYLPRGAAGRPLRRLFNGVQMAWHDHPVNRERAARGEPVINSLWFTGPTTPEAIGRWRDEAAAVVVDDGPLLARLNQDDAGWQRAVVAALERATLMPTLTRLVLTGEHGVREFVRRAPASAGAAPSAPTHSGAAAPAPARGADWSRRLGAWLDRLTGRDRDPARWFEEPPSRR